MILGENGFKPFKLKNRLRTNSSSQLGSNAFVGPIPPFDQLGELLTSWQILRPNHLGIYL